MRKNKIIYVFNYRLIASVVLVIKTTRKLNNSLYTLSDLNFIFIK